MRCDIFGGGPTVMKNAFDIFFAYLGKYPGRIAAGTRLVHQCAELLLINHTISTGIGCSQLCRQLHLVCFV